MLFASSYDTFSRGSGLEKVTDRSYARKNPKIFNPRKRESEIGNWMFHEREVAMDHMVIRGRIMYLMRFIQ